MKFWMFVTYCGECNEPIPFNPIDFIGYNPGSLDGHLPKSYAKALNDLDATRKAIVRDGYFYTTDTVFHRHYEDGRPFDGKDRSENLVVTEGPQKGKMCYDPSYLDKVHIVEVNLPIKSDK